MKSPGNVPSNMAIVFCCLFAAAMIISVGSVYAQTPCGQVGNHTIKVGKTTGSNHLTDCDVAHISRKNQHKITWMAAGNDTITIEFPVGANPFPGFTCKDQKKCTTGKIDDKPPAGSEFKYTVTVKSGGQTTTEDPRILIQD